VRRLAALASAAALVVSGCGSGTSTSTSGAKSPPPTVRTGGFHKTDVAPKKTRKGTHGGPEGAFLSAGAGGSWKALERSVPAQVGIAVEPFGPGRAKAFGALRKGHAWSSIKVPILVALMRESGAKGLSPEEEAWAREALTASDNTAAANLFGELEQANGGLKGASLAVQETLRAAGDDSTVVATAPPPPGAVSTFGQTEWSLPGSVDFYRSLGRGCLLDGSGTDYVLNLMSEVVPEQRWGLGEPGFPPSWQVGFKGGWGPEGSAAGPYLVRQSGVLVHGEDGVAVAMIAQANSGTFEGGISALNAEAAWLKENLRGLGPKAEAC
jgi:hypothetical protein